MIKSIIIGLLLTLSAQALENYQSFFKDNCINCHGPKKAKAKIRLDLLKWDPADEKSLEIWQEIVDQLKQGEMPPEDEPLPDKRDINSLIADIANRFKSLQNSPQVVLRRLNKEQYSNTVRDLFSMNTEQLNPAELFPADDETDGFTNLADPQMMSDFLLAQTLKAARKVVDHAVYPAEKPLPETHRMSDETPKKSRERYFWSGFPKCDDGTLNLYQNDEKEPGDTRGLSLISSYNGAPHHGCYDFTFEVESLGRGSHKKLLEKPFDPKYQKYHSEDLHRLEIYLISNKKTGKDVRGISRILLESIDLPDNKKIELKRRYWLYKGWRVQIAFGNGPAAGRLHHYYNRIKKEDYPKFKDKKEEKDYERKIVPEKTVKLIEELNLPRIKVHSASKSGPYYRQWPPLSHQAVYGSSVRESIRKFAEKAFRRPVKSEEIEHFVKLAENSGEGVRTAIEAILCSPNFLYIVEENDGRLNHYETAVRLSYFFWNSMPDEELFKLAKEEKLYDPEVLKTQALRMLKDPRAERFAHNFNWAWLKLKNTVEMAPDSVKFLDFKRYRISDSMLKETDMFFSHILSENLSLKTFIDSDFTFVNADLARRYGLGGINTTAKFQKAKLTDSIRGGLFGQTAVLTTSANGVETSPVVRGIWILENLLGIHPPPPPRDVNIPEIDLRGDLTLKQMYAKHRNIESCNSCHKKIDPLGFALENFNATGIWRDNYASGVKVDAGGNMPDGSPFNGINGLKQNILKDMTYFNRCLISKLLTYAAGRRMKAPDRVVIDKLTEKTLKEDTGLKDLILEVVTSKIFLNK